MSCQPCGCDPDIYWLCAIHAKQEAETDRKIDECLTKLPKMRTQLEGWTYKGSTDEYVNKQGDRITGAAIANLNQPIETSGFIVKDSGQRKQFDGGFVRDVTDDKVDYTLIQDGPMYDRWAIHLTKGAAKYGKRNWLKASDQEAYERFREGFARHARQVMRGDIDEDHKAACFFNLDGMARMEEKLGLKN